MMFESYTTPPPSINSNIEVVFRESLLIANAKVLITCHGSFDLITYVSNEYPLTEQFHTSKDYFSVGAL